MQPVLNCGGNWNNGDNAGLWNWNGNNSSSNANSNIGGRILIENYYVAHTILAPWQKTLRKEDGLVGLFSKDREEIKRIMKRVGFLYEKACDIDLIRYAIRQAAKGKTNKHYIAKVLANEESYALKIKEMLESNTLKLSPNRQIVLFDHSCMKERLITVPKFFPDQIIHWVVVLVLEPIFKKGMYRFNCGSVPSRGGLEAKKYVERVLKDEKVRYVAKLDISKFFNSVRPHYLMAMFRRKIKDEKFLRLIEAILENGGDCLPIGYYTSQWFSNFFLECFDHFVKEELKIKYYVRYVDDMVLLDTNKRKLRKAIEEIEKYLGNIGLKLKANYQVWKVHSRPIDFVGFRFYKDKTLLRKKIFFRLCRRVRRIRKTGYITVRQAQGILSLLGWLCHINGWKFYKERIYPYAPKWKLKLIVSNHAKKLNSEVRRNEIQQSKVVRVC